MANKLTDEKRAEMFAAFCEHQTLCSVSKKVQVSIPTLRRYKVSDRWVERYDKIKIGGSVINVKCPSTESSTLDILWEG